MKFELLHPADQLVIMMERIYQYGMTTTSGGNLSIRTPEGDIWITPGSIDKGNLRREDMIHVTPDGQLIGRHKPSVELPFHQHIYEVRPDLSAVLHAHPPALVAFSNVSRIPDTRIVPNVDLVCGKVGFAPYAIPGSKELGDKIASVFEEGYNAVMLENHGIVMGSENIFKAFMAFETLEFCARLEISASRIGTVHSLTDKHVQMSHVKQNKSVELDEFIPKRHSAEENNARREMVEFIHRSYDQRLFNSTEGTFSVRLSDGSFLITPYMLDRKYMQIEDIVLVAGDQREAGKNPSRSVMLHKSIYEKHPEINSVIIAHAPHIMSFAVTEREFDSRTIPESYIQLRTVSKLPYGSSFMQPDMVAEMLTESNPVVIVENDCIIVTGASLLNAFDRLEVAEYSAKSIIDSEVLGKVNVISDKEVKELETTFNLK